MNIEIKFICPINKQIEYVVGCVPWSSFDLKQTEPVMRFLFKFSSFDKSKSIDEIFNWEWINLVFNLLILPFYNMKCL